MISRSSRARQGAGFDGRRLAVGKPLGGFADGVLVLGHFPCERQGTSELLHLGSREKLALLGRALEWQVVKHVALGGFSLIVEERKGHFSPAAEPGIDRQIVHTRRYRRVVLAKCLLHDLAGALVELGGVVILPVSAQTVAEISQRVGNLGMTFAQNLLKERQYFAVGVRGFGIAAGIVEAPCQVEHRIRVGRMLFAERLFDARQVLFENDLGGFAIAALAEGDRQRIGRLRDRRMLGAKYLFANLERPFEQWAASAGRPASTSRLARKSRLSATSSCFGPKAASRILSARRNSVSASGYFACSASRAARLFNLPTMAS